jgi:hypothetical protein
MAVALEGTGTVLESGRARRLKLPAVLCYELTSEPIVAQTPGYYYGQIGRWWFVPKIAPPAAWRR